MTTHLRDERVRHGVKKRAPVLHRQQRRRAAAHAETPRRVLPAGGRSERGSELHEGGADGGEALGAAAHVAVGQRVGDGVVVLGKMRLPPPPPPPNTLTACRSLRKVVCVFMICLGVDRGRGRHGGVEQMGIFGTAPCCQHARIAAAKS
jgi:hypothetical protein